MITVLMYRFLESYFRHRWLYLLPIVFMMAIAGVYFVNLKPKYHAHGIIYVQTESYLAALNSVTASDNSWWSTPAQIVIGNMNELIRTDAYIRAVIHGTDLEKNMDQGSAVVSEIIDEVRKSIWINSLGDNQIQINAANEDPLIAFQITNSVLANFIQYQVNAQRTEGEAAQVFFADLIKTYESDLEIARENLKSYLLANPPPLRGNRPELEQLEIDRLQGEIQTAVQRYQSVLEKEEDARLALAQIEGDTRQSYRIIDAPVLPEKPAVSRKELAIQAALFLAAGVLLSLIAVAGNLIFDRSFRLPIDVKHGIHLPVLAMIPDTTVTYSLFHRIKHRVWRERDKEPKPVEETILPMNSQNDTELEIMIQPARRRGKNRPSPPEVMAGHITEQDRDAVLYDFDEAVTEASNDTNVVALRESIWKRHIPYGKRIKRKPNQTIVEENSKAPDNHEGDVSTMKENLEHGLDENEQDIVSQMENLTTAKKSIRNRTKKAASTFSSRIEDLPASKSNGKTNKSGVDD